MEPIEKAFRSERITSVDEQRQVKEQHRKDLVERAREILGRYRPIVLDMHKSIEDWNVAQYAAYEDRKKAFDSDPNNRGGIFKDVRPASRSIGVEVNVNQHNHRYDATSEHFMGLGQLPPIDLLPDEMSKEDRDEYTALLSGMNDDALADEEGGVVGDV